MSDERASRALSFGRAAELYDRRRPSYPDAAVDHVLDAVAGQARAMVEVGCGTGKATAVFARRAAGLSITCVEPDPAMAAVARRNVPSARVVVARFEEWGPPPHLVGGVDVVASAQAWHWVDRSEAVPKAARLLRPGGVMAVLANVPREGGHNLRRVLDPIYEEHVPGLVRTTGPLNWDGQFVEQEAEFRESGWFDVAALWSCDWDQPLSASEFGELLQTHSDFIAMPQDQVDALVADVQQAVEGEGGSIVMQYRTMVLLAIRR